MKIGIVGTRIFNNVGIELIERYIPKDCCKIITGGAIGIDSLAEQYAKMHNIPLIKHLPNYKIFGKQAPIIRNTLIVKESDKIIAFWDYKSRGTAHAIKESVRLNIPIEIINLNNILD